MLRQNDDLAKRIIDAITEMWKHTTPKIDLSKVEQKINPNNYTIPLSKFDAICKKYNVKITDSLYMFVNKTPKIDLEK